MNHPILQEALAIQEEIVAHRRYLHTHAESGFDIPKTKAYVRSQLEQLGYQVSDCGRAGLTAMAGTNQEGNVFLLRADVDALPIEEETGLPYASQTDQMHACGHDMHTAMLLGAAKILKNHEAELKGRVKLMFQPAEELLSGAKDMIGAGVLENPKVNAGMMIHVATAVPIPSGTLLIAAPGISAPTADYFTIEVTGKSCHGSMPQEGVDALTAAAHILIALQEIEARELGIRDDAVMTIGSLHAGKAANVIPDSAVMSGTSRTFDDNTRTMIKTRIEEIAGSIARAFRAKATVSYGSGTPALVNNRKLCEFAEGCLTDLLGSRAVPVAKLSAGKPTSGGSEDFAYVSQEIPTVMMSLAAGEPQNGYTYPLHHPKVMFDESALPYGAAAHAWVAMQYLK